VRFSFPLFIWMVNEKNAEVGIKIFLYLELNLVKNISHIFKAGINIIFLLKRLKSLDFNNMLMILVNLHDFI